MLTCLTAALVLALAPDEDARRAADLSNALGLRALVAAGPENAALSPTALTAMLLMVHQGARGETERELSRALGLGEDGRAWLADGGFEAFRALLVDQVGETPRESRRFEGEARATCAVFAQRGHPFLDEARRDLQRLSPAGMRLVDLRGEPARAAEAINAWITDATKGTLTGTLRAEDLGAQTSLVLVGAAYLQSPWRRRFYEDATKDAPFHLRAGEPVDVPFLHARRMLPYAEDEHTALVTLDLQLRGWQVALLLPRAGTLNDAWLESLTPAAFRRLHAAREKAEVDLALPKLDLRHTLDAEAVLRTAGVERALSDTADLSRFDAGRGTLRLSRLHQPCVLTLDETGLTAAAQSTSYVIAGRDAEPRKVTFRADRPFVVAVTDVRTGQWLFLARVEDPR